MVKYAIKQNPLSIRFASVRLRSDLSIMLPLIKYDERIFRFSPDFLIRDKFYIK